MRKNANIAYNSIGAYLRSVRTDPAQKGAIAGWFQQGCSAGVAILLIPILLRLLTKEEAGIWFSFQGFIGIASLADFGFGFTISRQVAYTMGRRESNTPRKDFLDYGSGWEGVTKLMHHAKSLYVRIIGISALISIALFEIVLPHTKLNVATSEFRLLWYFMAASGLCLLSLSRFSALLIGLNYVYLVRILSGCFFLLQGCSVAICAYYTRSLTLMAACSLVATIINWVVIRMIVATLAKPIFQRSNFKNGDIQLPRLFRVAAPMGIINLSAYLITSIQVPLIGALIGPASVAPFYLAQKIGQFMNMVPLQIVQAKLPTFTMHIAAGETQSAKSMLQKTVRTLFYCGIIVNILFLIGSPHVAEFLSGSRAYPSTAILGVMAVDYLLSALAVVWGHFVLSSGTNPFVLSTILHGAFSIVLLFFLVPQFGLIAVPLSALIGGALTNYWFNPYHGRKLARQL